MFKLREYQEECVDKIVNMKEGSKKIACLATGAGKTIIMSEVCKRVSGRVLIIVMSKELKEQTVDKLKMVCGNKVDVGCIQGSQREYNHRIVVAMRQTLTSASFPVKELLKFGRFDYILIDEGHVAVSQAKKIIEYFANDSTKIACMTATPYNEQMKEVYNGFIYRRELIDMIKDGYLIDPVGCSVKTNISLDNVRTYQGDFMTTELSSTVDTDMRNQIIYKAYIDKCQDRNKTIIFATDVKHSKSIAKYFNDRGISAKSIDGSLKAKERKQILDDFHSGKIKVLINVMILTIGFDCPSVDCIIFARPTQSKALYIQMIGRGLRLSPETDKKDCLIIDVVDICNKHNLMNCKTIFDMNSGESMLQAKNKKIVYRSEKKKIMEEDVEHGVSSIDAMMNKIESATDMIMGNIGYAETNLFDTNNKDCNYNNENSLQDKDKKENIKDGKIKDKNSEVKKADKKSSLMTLADIIKKIFNLK